jgi:hypothetical protein
VVSQAELQEAQSKTIECIAASGTGINAFYETDQYGISSLTFGATESASPGQQQVVSGCDTEWSGSIQALYWTVALNPDKGDWEDLVAACLVRHNLVAPSFTGADYVEVLDRYYETNPGLRLEIQIDIETGIPENEVDGAIYLDSPPVSEIPDIILPGGASMSDPVAMACEVVPLR